MIRFVGRVLIVSAIGVLMMPGNEVHRDRVLHGLSAAYANAARYCDKNPRECKRITASLELVGATISQEASKIASSTAQLHPADRVAEQSQRYLERYN